MNLRVDLILDTEKRSASVVNTKSLLRIFAICVPVILVVIIAVVTMNMIRLNSDLKECEDQMKIKGPKRDAAIAFRGEVGKIKQTLSELEGWQKSRINWHEQLLSLQAIIPADIQLTSLKINYSPENADNVPARTFNLILKGKALGEKSRINVEFLGDIKKNTNFTGVIKDSNIIIFSKNEVEGAREGEMLFEINGAYIPRKFR